MNVRSLVVLAVPLFAAACLLAYRPGVSGEVDLTDPGEEYLRMVYLGSGGWIMQYRDATVLSGPLFSNPGLFRAGLADIHSDTVLVDRYMSRYDVSDALAILVGHAHYDHLMDVPRVAQRHAPEAAIVGSETTFNILGTWSGLADRIDVVNDSAATQETPGRWLRYGDGRVRILPLVSHHAPHFYGYTLYRGERDSPRNEPPRWASDWVDGETFAFLVDFMASEDSIAFRVYYQDAVAPAPMGFAPDALIAERPVDVAILVPSTFDQVEWHPEAFVENLRPARVVLGHWEDFFSPIEAETRSIRLTDLGYFEARLERVLGGSFWRPELWTEFRFPAR